MAVYLQKLRNFITVIKQNGGWKQAYMTLYRWVAFIYFEENVQFLSFIKTIFKLIIGVYLQLYV